MTFHIISGKKMPHGL